MMHRATTLEDIERKHLQYTHFQLDRSSREQRIHIYRVTNLIQFRICSDREFPITAKLPNNAYEQCTKVGCSKCQILCQNAPVPLSHELVISTVAAFVAFEQTDRRNHTEFNTWAR